MLCQPCHSLLHPPGTLQVKETLGLGEAKAERAAERTTGHPHHKHTGVGTTAERPGTEYTGGVAGGQAYTGTAVSGGKVGAALSQPVLPTDASLHCIKYPMRARK